MSNIIRIAKIEAINCYDLSPSFSLKTHTHEDWEMIFVDSGTLDYISDGRRVSIKKGEILFHRPGVPHRAICDGVHSVSFFNMILRTSSRAMNTFDKSSFKVPKELLPMLRLLIAESERSYIVSAKKLSLRPDAPDDGEQTVKLLCELFLLKLRRHIIDGSNNKGSGVIDVGLKEPSPDAVIEYLTEHISDRITLDMLSEHFHFGKTYLCVQFKKKTGKAILDYFLDLKITEAKRILREESLTIQAISESLGFDSPEYFSRLFKKRVGYSPREFRGMLITGTKVRRK